MSESKTKSDGRRLNDHDSHGQPGVEESLLMDARGRTVAWMTRTVHRLFDAQAQKILDKKNLSIAYWYYLRVLAERGELSQVELSRRVGVSSTTAVPALDNMEKRGLVRRVNDPKDRRKHFVRLTDKGKRTVDEMLPSLVALMKDATRTLRESEIRIFWKVMHEIENNIGDRSDTYLMSD
jgi:DNA-binding MarR family transcriptional regulator